MATFLPTVNEFESIDDSSKKAFALNILGKITPKISSSLVSKNSIIKRNIEKTFTIEKENQNEDILTKLYTFITTDYKRKQLMDADKRNRLATTQKENDNRMEYFVSALLSSREDAKSKKQESEKDKKSFSLGLGMFVTASVGLMLYRNMDDLEKLFDIRKLETDIKNLTGDFDMGAVVDNIRTVINDTISEIQKLKMPDFNFDFGDIDTGKGTVDVTLEKLPSISDTGISTDEMGAKKTAEQYLGREMSSTEWDELLRVTGAEAGTKANAREQAMIMATVLNRVKSGKYGSTVSSTIRAKGQFESVTGSAERTKQFRAGPSQKRKEQILYATQSVLPAVSKKQVRFTAADPRAYKSAKGLEYRNKLLREGGTTIGGTVFNTSISDISSESIKRETQETSSKVYDFKPLRERKAFIIHHTGGRGNIGGVMSTFEQTKNFAHFVIDREGNIYRTVPEGMRGTHMIKGSGKGEGLSNINTEGVEIIAKDDKDVLPVQVEAAKKLAASLGYKSEQIYGHGEVNPGHKQATEGMTVVSSIRKEGLKPVSGIKVLDYSTRYKSKDIKSQQLTKVVKNTDKHTAVIDYPGEPGELGDNDSSKIPKSTSSGATKHVSEEDKIKHKITWNPASDKDLIGIKFNSHPGLPSHLDSMITVEQARTVQALRGALGKNTLTVKSGFRPPWYNKTRRGAADNSLHKYGKACDISTDGMSVDEIVKFVRAASKVGFGGIAYYPTMNFVHCDIGNIRTWPTPGRVPASIQRAISEHVGARHGQLAPAAHSAGSIPDLPEPNELPDGASSPVLPDFKIPNISQMPLPGMMQPDEVEQGKKEPLTVQDFITQGIEEAKTIGKVIDSAMGLMKETNLSKLNETLQQFSQNIPRKEKANIQSPIVNTPITNIFNTTKEENIYNQNDFSDDNPALFVNPFLAQLGKLNG